jgi:glucose/arabinose dehydrogenase
MNRPAIFAALAGVALACCLTLSNYFSSGSSARAQTTDLPTLALASPVGGFSSPVGVTHAGDGSGRIFVVEQGGRIRVVKSGAAMTAPFLDISTRISSGGERGLLGLAFPYDYARRGYFYVDYTNPSGDTVISRFRVSASNPDAADPASEQILLTIAQPFANHNGGQLAFGRDGYLYVGMGDGGSGGDPGNRAQNPAELLGKILRIDVETGRPYTYTVPASNPFVGRAGFRPEIWALGVRNPWRFSFDRLTADLFIADVGQGAFEEVDFQPASSRGGENYGWRIMEGTHCFNPNPCDMTGLTLPVVEYGHAAGDCSVTGGYVYRASMFPRMRGLYFYGDFCSGRIWALRHESSGAWTNTLLLDTNIQLSAFGEDEAGNLYAASYGSGQIFQVVDNGPTQTPNPTPTPEIKFGSPTFITTEPSGGAVIPVVRSGDTTVRLSVDYATSDGTASERKDYTTAVGTLRFAAGETAKTIDILVNEDSFVEGNETFTVSLSNPTGGGTLSCTTAVATITITDDASEPATNVIDDPTVFVGTHYHDFLNRQADPDGLAFWANQIIACGADAACVQRKRTDVSTAFFLSIEFQQTGFLVFRFYRESFADTPGRPRGLPRYREFLRDTQEIRRGVVVGAAGWETVLEANKQTFARAWVQRPEFVAQFPTGMTAAQYVDKLFANAGATPTTAERNAAIAAYGTGDTDGRAAALRSVAESNSVYNAQFNPGFVLMQYIGYLRRNPNDPPDTDFSGYDFWLAKMNSFSLPGENVADPEVALRRVRRAEMVRAFIESIEYRGRFGSN